MGDRANIHVLAGDTEGVFLYTHWDGSYLPQVLQDALKRGEARWSDAPYLARIIFCEMVKDCVMELRGYGITSRVTDGAGRIIQVNPDKQIVSHKGLLWSFEEYVKLDLSLALPDF